MDARLGQGANAIKTTFVVVSVVNAVRGVVIAVIGVIVAIASQLANKSLKKEKKNKNRCGFASLSRPLYRPFRSPLLLSSAPSEGSIYFYQSKKT